MDTDCTENRWMLRNGENAHKVPAMQGYQDLLQTDDCTAGIWLWKLNTNELIARVEPCGTFVLTPKAIVAFWVFFYFCWLI